MTFKKLACAAALACSAFAGIAQGAVVFSEDFESYSTSAFGTYGRYGLLDAPWSWTSTGHSTVVFGPAYAPSNIQGAGGGDNAAQLEWQGDAISQSFATTIGATYILTFLLDGYSPPGTGSVDVSIDGGAATSFGPAGPAWTAETLTFTALFAFTNLTFTNNLGYPNSPNYTHLDSIVVTAVPEPATLALLGLGLAGFGFSRRKQ
jgi:PEP-CTERM motif-containing protein